MDGPTLLDMQMDELDLKLSASGIVRLYLWDQLLAQLPEIWGGQLEGGGIPIIPAQDQPETQVSDSPYIVYVADTLPTNDLFSYQREAMHFRVFSQSTGTINSTMRLFGRLMNKWDITARDLNRWVRHPDGLKKYLPAEWMDEARNFQFKTIRVVSAVGIEPSGGEGKRVDASMSLEVGFIEVNMGLPKSLGEGRFMPEIV